MPNFVEIFSNLLLSLNDVVGNMGLVIIIFTILIRAILVPLTLPSIKAREKITKLKPELDKIKNKHKNDKTALAQAQMELYKKYNVNPASGCLPQILQIIILIILYRSLVNFLNPTDGSSVSTQFLWFDLLSPDPLYILPILTAVFQLLLSLMIAPGGEVADLVPNNSKSKKVQQENKKEEDMAEMAASMQKQMIFMMPLMTGIMATRFPAGLALYWAISTIFSIVQQFVLSGPGGLKTYYQRLLIKLGKNN
jgi:YidC/Oxa1 family membrane protein insertase